MKDKPEFTYKLKEYGISSDSIKKFIANGFETEELFNLISDELESVN